MQSWKQCEQCALPVVSTMTLWELMHLCCGSLLTSKD